MKVRWSWLSLPLLTAIVACNSIIGFNDLQKVDDSTTRDGGTGSTPSSSTPSTPTASTTGTTPPPSTLCSNSRAWGTPQLVPGVNSTNTDRIVSLSSDELTMVFQNSQGSDRASSTNVFLATRAAKTATFGAPAAISTLTGGNRNFEPSLSSDGLTIFWDAVDANNQFSVLYRATRAAGGTFATPTQLPNIAAASTDTLSPFISADGAELFMLRASSPNAPRTIFHSLKSGADFGAPSALAEIGVTVTGDVDAIALSADRLTLYFSSATTAGGLGGYDIFMSSRSSTTSAFIAPTPVTALNSSSGDDVGWVSADNCRVYMSSDRGGNDDIYMASRTPQ